jgi:hypothetical protein
VSYVQASADTDSKASRAARIAARWSSLRRGPKYIEKVLMSAKGAYLTMNSGTSDGAFQDDKISLDELRDLLPNFETLPEEPVTHPGNYVIVWGHR